MIVVDPLVGAGEHDLDGVDITPASSSSGLCNHVPGAAVSSILADAGPAFKNPSRWGHFIVAYRVHYDSTSDRPLAQLAEGAAYVGGDTGINRAECMAATMGL